MGLIDRLVDGSLMPHGYCLLWRADLVFLHFSGDLITALAYFSIPAALVHLVRKRKDLEFDWVFLMFALFIFFCGITHAMAILNLWQGYYFLAGLAKLLTGIVSGVTAFMVWKLMPRALSIPSQDMLLEKVYALEVAESDLERTNIVLEKKVRERTLQLERLAKTDDLTGINNRREVLDALNTEVQRFARYGHPLSIQVIDLDDFKTINDNRGHVAGDNVLKQFADFVAGNIRETDIFGRLGGEEFLVVMPSTDLAGARVFAERLCDLVARQEIFAGENPLHITCSIGIAQALAEESASELLHRADEAMYDAKRAGKNQARQAN